MGILVMQLSPEESNRQCWRLGDLSAHLDVLLPFHCADSSGRPGRCHERGVRPEGQGSHPVGPGLDRGQLVHLPDRLRLPDDGDHGDRAEPGRPILTGTPFNDAYRYMDWLLTVPLLLIEIILVMQLSPEESNRQCWRLGTLSALMILSGYKGELVLTGDLTPRWISWLISISFFLFIVQTLLVGLS